MVEVGVGVGLAVTVTVWEGTIVPVGVVVKVGDKEVVGAPFGVGVTLARLDFWPERYKPAK